MANSDYRTQLSVALLGLEQTHLAKQSYETGRHLLLHTTEPANTPSCLRDVLSRLHECSKTARKYRYRLATVLVQTAATGAQAMPLLQAATKQSVACIKLESQASMAHDAWVPPEAQAADVEELAGLAKAIAAAVAELPTHAADDNDLGRFLLNPMMLGIVRAPSQETAATGHVLLGAALEALIDAPSSTATCASALPPCLEQQLHNMNSGSPRMGVPQAYGPVQQCLRGLAAPDLPAAIVRACTKACLHGVRHKEQWAMRREALLTMAHLAEALQRANGGAFGNSAEGHELVGGQLPPGTCFLLDAMPKLLPELEKVRYDKIQHVRSAADKALRSLQTLAACSHRSDIAAMPTPERPLTASERPRSAARRGTAVSSNVSMARAPLMAVGNTPASATEKATPTKRRSLTPRVSAPGELDFGVQVFAPQPPTPDQAACDAAASTSTANSASTTAEQPEPPQVPPEQQQKGVAAAAAAEPEATPCDGAGPAAAAQATAALPEPAPALSAPTQPATATPLPAAPATAGPEACDQAQPCAAAEADTVAGPLRLQMNGSPVSAKITLDPHQGLARLQSLQQLQVWVHGDAAELGIEVVADSSSRPGVLTVHRFVCKNGLMSREVVDRLAEPRAPALEPESAVVMAEAPKPEAAAAESHFASATLAAPKPGVPLPCSAAASAVQTEPPGAAEVGAVSKSVELQSVPAAAPIAAAKPVTWFVPT